MGRARAGDYAKSGASTEKTVAADVSPEGIDSRTMIGPGCYTMGAQRGAGSEAAYARLFNHSLRGFFFFRRPGSPAAARLGSSPAQARRGMINASLVSRMAVMWPV